jgi:hypothetical protein
MFFLGRESKEEKRYGAFRQPKRDDVEQFTGVGSL